jgi:hypothetical protein
MKNIKNLSKDKHRLIRKELEKIKVKKILRQHRLKRKLKKEQLGHRNLV